VYLVYAFFTWEATGTWPLNLPNVNVPSIPVPSFLHPVQQESPTLHRLVNQVSTNWVAIVLGTAVGLIFGIFLVGLVADTIKALFRFGRQPEVVPVTDVEGDVLPSESA
jgi:hypothetical protein